MDRQRPQGLRANRIACPKAAVHGTHQIDGKSEAAQTIRAMMESVTVHHNPSSEKGLRIELKGRFSAFQEQKSPPVMAGFQRVTALSGGNDGSGGPLPLQATHEDMSFAWRIKA